MTAAGRIDAATTAAATTDAGTTAAAATDAGTTDERALRDRAYSPSLTVPDLRTCLRAYADGSARARADLAWQEIPYGAGPDRILHFFPAVSAFPAAAPGPEPAAPLQIFIHGGYWQELSAADSSFAAPDFVSRGAAFAALGYGLAPANRLDEIVAMVREAVLWLFRNVAKLGVDPRRIFVSGSSAGAHLAAMCLVDGWLPAPLHPTDVIRGACLLSGIYDLEPLRHTYVGEQIRLTAAEAARNSPFHRLRGTGAVPSLIIARGDNETSAFAAQHRQFVSALTGSGIAPVDLVVPGRNHFDLPETLGDPDEPLGRAVLAQMGLPQRAAASAHGSPRPRQDDADRP
ncbi:arylformamidase [Parafrankia irregularis]|uniref:Arylformamidase n=1 Tax=Parafrankia irregularis TaxID=795642 RepID=A0A0S4QUH2_9ACTN|nr:MULTISPECIES: alpha/beta hydrolase [Parafrankia]MBE3202448.1 alpha/beta hydrolase [Parafrankia sp. CH37]CUU58964.1 arylformamidase [Parafrankia irregularis]